jgi:flagellar biosynthesis protein FlhG
MNFKRLIASLQRKSQVRVIALAGKGGVGKSVISANLALACAEQGAHVLLFDANLGLGNLDLIMGVQVKRTIKHVLAGDCDLNDVLLDAAHNVKILPAAIGDEHIASLSPLELSGLIHAFSELPKTPDVFVVDTPSGITEHNVHFMTAAQDILLVVNDELPSLIAALAFIKVLSTHSVRHFHIVINQVATEAMAENLFRQLMMDTACYDNVTLDLAGIILNDPRMHESVTTQTPLMMLFPHSYAANGFRNLANSIFDWKKPHIAHGTTGFFVEQLAGA